MKNTPELRFKGFDDDWEEKSFSEIFTERHEISTITEEYPQLSFTIAEGVIRPEDRKTNQRDFLIKDKDNKQYLKTEVDDIIYNPANVVFGAIHRNGLCKGVVSPIYKIFFTDEDSQFMEGIVRNPDFIKKVSNQTEGTVTKLKTLKPEIFLQMAGVISPYLKEQQKIGKMLSKVDSLIELKTKKLESLKSVKKSLLQKCFPKAGAKVPEIRFEHFSGVWEEKRLEEIASFSKGHGYSKNDLVIEGCPIILYGRLYTNYETEISVVDTFVIKQVNSVLSKGGEVIVPASGETAEDISRASAVKMEGIILGGDLNIISLPKEQFDPTFVALSISNGDSQKELSQNAQGKTIVHLHNDDLMKVSLLYPSLAEQNKIVQLFSKYDTLIKLHQKKIDKLKTIKKSLLQKMFV